MNMRRLPPLVAEKEHAEPLSAQHGWHALPSASCGACFVPLAFMRTAACSKHGGMAQLANTTGLNRETLYRTLSENGKPRLSSLGLIVEALGLRLSIESPEEGPRAA